MNRVRAIVSTVTDSVLLEARDVGKTFEREGKKVSALRGLSLGLGAKEIVAIVGPSGCGKTTGLRLMAGLERPTSGLILSYSLPDTNKSKPISSFVFQKTILFPWRTTIENILLPVLYFVQLLYF